MHVDVQFGAEDEETPEIARSYRVAGSHQVKSSRGKKEGKESLQIALFAAFLLSIISWTRKLQQQSKRMQ